MGKGLEVVLFDQPIPVGQSGQRIGINGGKLVEAHSGDDVHDGSNDLPGKMAVGNACLRNIQPESDN
jgi:hypothetical protein